MESPILRCMPVHWKDARKTYEPRMTTTLDLGKSIVILYCISALVLACLS
jgi:hypothetical protein